MVLVLHDTISIRVAINTNIMIISHGIISHIMIISHGSNMIYMSVLLLVSVSSSLLILL